MAYKAPRPPPSNTWSQHNFLTNNKSCNENFILVSHVCSYVIDHSIFKLVNTNALATMLAGYQDSSFVINGFTHGFPLGLQPKPTLTPAPDSKRPTTNRLRLKVEDEVSKGRLLGPFSHPPLENLMLSPLCVIPKPNSDKVRLIFNLSSPSGFSVNDNIPPSNRTVSYCTVEEAGSYISSIASPAAHTFLAKVDLTDAYRLVPIQQADWPYLGMKVGADYYIDRCLPMGAASSCQIFQRISNALAWMFQQSFPGPCQLFNYLDDFLFIATSEALCRNALLHFLHMTTILHIPVAHHKTEQPATRLSFLGIGLDTVSKTMYIPEKKAAAALQLLTTFVQRDWAKVKQWQKIIGTLCHLSQVISAGRIYLGSLHESLRGILSQQGHKLRKLSNEVKEDLSVWINFLRNSPPTKAFQFLSSPPKESFRVYTDASSSIGFGGMCQDQWFYGTWREHNVNESNIAVLELYPILWALYNWVGQFENKVVGIYTDNHSLVPCLNKLYSKDATLRKLIKPITQLCLNHNIRIVAYHIAGKKNIGPDLLSRGRIRDFQKKFVGMQYLPTPIIDCVRAHTY